MGISATKLDTHIFMALAEANRMTVKSAVFPSINQLIYLIRSKCKEITIILHQLKNMFWGVPHL